MKDFQHFRNFGLGWVCKKCDGGSESTSVGNHSRLLTEGEAEGKMPELSNRALAKWTSAERDTLMCPNCGVTEMIT
jgi:hypothetical protein